MPGKILGLDISRGFLTAVQVTSGLKGYEIIACCRVMIPDNSLEKALESISQQIDIKSDIYAAALPAEEVSIRNLSMPFSDPKKIRQTLPFEIETMSPFPLDDLVLDFNISDRSKQSEVLSVSVKKAYIAEYLSILNQFGIDPDILDIKPVPTASWLLKQKDIPADGLLLDIGLMRNTMVLYQKSHISLIRNSLSNGNDNGKTDPLTGSTPEQIESCLNSFCKTIQNTLHSFKWQTSVKNYPEKIFYTGIGALYPGTGKILSKNMKIPAEHLNISSDKKISMGFNIANAWKPALMDGALALTIRESKMTHGFNFRKDEFETKKYNLGLWREIRKVLISIVIILIFLAINLGTEYNLLKKEYDTVEKKISELFKKEFPDITRIVDPVHQAKIKINEIKTAAVSIPAVKSDRRVLDLLKDISQRVSKNYDVRITSMVVDMESIRISGETDSFNTVDNIKVGLEVSDYFTNVTISSANLGRAGEQIQFEMKLQRTN